MIEWKNIANEQPEPGKMCLVFTHSSLTAQAYFSGDSFHEPWGREYPGSKQPKWWAELSLPPTISPGQIKTLNMLMELPSSVHPRAVDVARDLIMACLSEGWKASCTGSGGVQLEKDDTEIEIFVKG